MRSILTTCVLILAVLLFSSEALLNADVIKTRHKEGPTHGLLVVRALGGQIIADGDFTQVELRDRLSSHVILHFRDGSLYDELTEFAQKGNFKLLRDHLIQKGPSFKPQMETNIDVSTGQFTAQYEEKGEKKEINEHVDLPPDVSNGLVWTLLKNIEPSAESAEISILAASPKPRIVKLQIHKEGAATFVVDQKKLKAVHFMLHTKIEGAAGVVAPLIGKQPPDSQAWILDGAVPLF